MPEYARGVTYAKDFRDRIGFEYCQGKWNPCDRAEWPEHLDNRTEKSVKEGVATNQQAQGNSHEHRKYEAKDYPGGAYQDVTQVAPSVQQVCEGMGESFDHRTDSGQKCGIIQAQGKEFPYGNDDQRYDQCKEYCLDVFNTKSPVSIPLQPASER